MSIISWKIVVCVAGVFDLVAESDQRIGINDAFIQKGPGTSSLAMGFDILARN
jgi:hypothetical protein